MGRNLAKRSWVPAALAVLALGTACSTRGPAPAAPVGRGGSPWPMFGRTLDRNMVSLDEKGAPTEWSTKKGKEANIKWKAKLGSQAYGGPVIAAGRIFVSTNNDSPRDPALKGDKGVLMCFNLADGAFLWQALHDKLDEANDYPKVGIVSNPVVEGDRLWYVSNRGEVICASVDGDPATKKSKELWKLDMIGELGVFPCQSTTCSPLVLGDLVFVVTGNGVDVTQGHKLPAPKAPSFIAVNKDTGKVVWKDSSPGENIMEGQWSNPTAAEVDGKWQVISPGGDGWLYSFEPTTGKLLWRFDCNPKKAVYNANGSGDRNYFIATPVVWQKKCYIGVGSNPENGAGVGHLWCIDITKEPKNPQRDLSPVGDDFDPKSPKNKDSGLVWHVGGPILPRPDEGREYHFGRTLGTVAIHDGLVYASEFAGFLNCFDALTGKRYWERDLKDNTWCSPYFVDGKVYIGVENGDVFIFEHGKEPKEPKKVSMDGNIKLPPVVAGGVLYINNGTSLYAIAPK